MFLDRLTYHMVDLRNTPRRGLADARYGAVKRLLDATDTPNRKMIQFPESPVRVPRRFLRDPESGALLRSYRPLFRDLVFWLDFDDENSEAITVIVFDKAWLRSAEF